MAKITIAELDIDVQAMLASTSQVKKVIDDLKKSQAELVKSGDTNSKAFVENASNLKVLNAEYTAGVKALSDNTKATADQANRTDLLNLALKGEVSSIAEARAQNTLLNKLRNETNVTTEEGKAQLTELNKKLDSNNDFIKENADAYLKQKINIGNYSDSIKDALQNLNPFNGGIAGFTQRAQEAGGAGNLMKSSVAGVTSGIGGMIKASLAFIATPIGAVIAIVAGAALILYNVFAKLDPVMDKIEQITAAVGAAFDTARQAIMAFVTGAKSLTEAFSNLGGSMASAAKDAAKLKEAQQDLNDALSSQEVTNAKAMQQYDELILKSKNKTLTEKESIAYLNQAQGILEANFKQRTALANAELKNAIEAARIKGDLSDQEVNNLQRNTVAYANYLLNSGRISQAEYDNIKKAELGKIAIQSEATSRREKAQNREDKLNEDAATAKQKANDDAIAAQEKATARAEKAIEAGISKSKTELEFFIASQGFKAKSLEDELKLAEQVRDKKLAILRTELEKGKITQAEYNLQALTEKQTFLKAQADITIANADIELKAFIDANKTKLDANQFLTDELLNQELSRLASIGDAQKTAELARFTNGLINKQAYEDGIKAIDEKTKADQDAVLITKDEADKEKQAIDLQSKMDADAVNHDYDLAWQLKKFDEENAVERANAVKHGADMIAFDEATAAKKKSIEKAVQDNRLQLASQTFGNLADLLGRESAAGKAAAIAQVTIDTYKSATAAYASLSGIPVVGPALGAVAAGVAVASGLMNVKKILSTETPKKFEQGGLMEVGGNRHSAGGTKFYGEDGTVFEAEQGEGIGVLNRGAFASFMDFNNSHGNGKSTPTFMAGGGIITQGVQSQSNGMNADDILNIIKSMPAPVVAVTDIHSASDNYARVVNGADF